ncbi:MAG: hypothetical protein JXR66_10470, partial [Bacteroidales bacterium]|nr:hypothetical protein [Bacteroidales bacterium]
FHSVILQSHFLSSTLQLLAAVASAKVACNLQLATCNQQPHPWFTKVLKPFEVLKNYLILQTE